MDLGITKVVKQLNVETRRYCGIVSPGFHGLPACAAYKTSLVMAHQTNLAWVCCADQHYPIFCVCSPSVLV